MTKDLFCHELHREACSRMQARHGRRRWALFVRRGAMMPRPRRTTIGGTATTSDLALHPWTATTALYSLCSPRGYPYGPARHVGAKGFILCSKRSLERGLFVGHNE